MKLDALILLTDVLQEAEQRLLASRARPTDWGAAPAKLVALQHDLQQARHSPRSPGVDEEVLCVRKHPTLQVPHDLTVLTLLPQVCKFVNFHAASFWQRIVGMCVPCS